MFNKKQFAILMSIFLLIPTFILAQPGNSKPEENQDVKKKKPIEVSAETKEKANKMLVDVSKDAGQFVLPDNRIRAQMVIADLLWEQDEKEGRAIFQNIFADLQAMFSQSQIPTDGQTKKQIAESARLWEKVKGLRREYILALAVRDPKLALDALSALKSTKDDENEWEGMKFLELAAATAIIEKDPKQSYELAKKNLDNNGVTYPLFATLESLYKKDSENGAKLAGDILSKLKSRARKKPSVIRPASANTANVAIGGEGNEAEDSWEIMQYPTELLRIAAASLKPDKKAKPETVKKTPILTDSELKELADLIATAYVGYQYSSPYQVSGVMKEIAKYSPTAAAQIRRKLGAEGLKQLEEITSNQEKYESSAEELLKNVDKVPLAERDQIYYQAIRKTLDDDHNPEKAREIASKIQGKDAYNYLFDEIDRAILLGKAEKGELREVRQMLANYEEDTDKVSALTELATALAEKGENEVAGKVLDEARQFIPSRIKNNEQLTMTLELAKAYADIDADQGFALLENTISQMNDVINAAALIDDFYNYGSSENEEVLFQTIQRQAFEHIPSITIMLKKFAAKDFTRTMNLADKFGRAEIRFYARITIAKSLLDPKAEENETKERETSRGGEARDID